MACIDPATGRLVTPDQSPECAVALEAARKEEAERMRTRDDTKALEEQPLEDGGSKVDLDGQFRQTQVVPGAREVPVTGGQIAIIDPRNRAAPQDVGTLADRCEAGAGADRARFYACLLHDYKKSTAVR